MSDVTSGLGNIEVPAEVMAGLDAAFEADGFTDAGTPATLDGPPDGFDPGNSGQTQGVTAPNEATPAPTPAEEPGQAPPVPVEGVVEDSFTERFDPNSLPPDLVPAYKAMQADYTRKRQADAEAVRFYEQATQQGIDLAAAVDLFQRMQDPDGLMDFIQQASDYLTSEGYAEWDGVGQDPNDPTNQAPQVQDPDLAALLSQDPELAPLAQAFQTMQQRLDSFEQERNMRLEAEREEAQMLSVLGEFQRQENAIRQANPQYRDEDIDAIYELAAFHDGDLLQAQASYEGIFARRLGSYLQSKDLTPMSGGPMGGGQAPNGAVFDAPTYDPLNDKEAHEAALDFLRVLESQPDV